MKVFREGIRPALSTGLSVTRVGTRGYNERQKDQNSALLKALAAFEQAQEFSHFGAELADNAKADITRGNWLRQVFTQVPGETYNLTAQQLIIAVVLESPTTQPLDIAVLKRQAIELAKNIKGDSDFEIAKTQLIEQSTSPAPQPAKETSAEAAKPEAKPKEAIAK
jgi:F-type H+-transporting ATPase subunit alpha